ncbi:MAG UNVERIFIED_CONTAM: hypothetical protein LVQ98_02360 [Rickettsiaceae bacterium]|jgi:rhodanese-related sulfurtransferase
MKNITPLEAIELLSKKDAVLVDVRQYSEWQAGYPDFRNDRKRCLAYYNNK